MRAYALIVASCTALAVAAGVSWGRSAAPVPAASLAAVADAYVTAAKPRANFGSAGRLVVARRPVSIAYLRFRVSLPVGATVARATLRLFASTSAQGFRVYRVASTTWREDRITYTKAPAVGALVAASVPGDWGRGTVSVDVSPLVTRSGFVSLALETASGTPLSFKSRESGGGGPRLLVETTAAGQGTEATGTGAPCGTAAAPRTVDHVIWIWMENKGYDAVIGSPSAPFENQLAGACGLGTSYHGVAHPSLPNYIAATSGSTQGITDDADPQAHPLDVPSIFSQVKAAGKSWRSYEESSPGNCPQTSSGRYAVRHDPATYYTGIRGDCANWDVPMGSTSGGSLASDLASGNLPAFAFLTPDLCDDTHDCPVATGDAWLQSWFAKILASPAYLAGDTVVFVVWDEDDLASGNHIPFLVVSPSTRPGTQSGGSFDHFALLKTTEQLLGLGFLGQAADAPSMLSAFNLG
jgi:hypothetical protein